jgi:hypothetical protein
MSDLLLSGENRYVRQMEGYGSHKFTPAGAFVAAANPAAPTAIEVAAEAVLLRKALNDAVVNQQCLNELEVAPNTEVTLCIPLELSTLVGQAQQKILPLWMMGEVVIEITLNKDCVFNVSGGANAAAREAAQPVFQVSEVEFHAALIEFDASVNSALVSMAAGDGGGPALGLNLSGCTWTNSMVSLTASSNTLVNNERLRSIKSMFLAFIQSGLTYADRKTARNPNAITSLQYKFGSQYLPSYPIRGNAADPKHNGEFVVETIKAIADYGNSMWTGLVNNDSFANVGHANDDCGRAVFGIDCDCFHENVESGLSTVENNPITVKWDRPAPAGGAPGQDVYLCIYHDVLYNILLNGVVTRSAL